MSECIKLSEKGLRTKIMAGTITICLAAAVAGNVFEMVGPSEVELKGVAGGYADRCIRARAYSGWARGDMYGECENAFTTHQDDEWGTWQGEYWGKTMLSFAGAVEYTEDVSLREWVLEKAHDFIATHQKPNGFVSTFIKEDNVVYHNKNGRMYDGVFNVWGRKYTMWALVELYRVTGDETCLEAAVKMADHLVAQMKRLGVNLNETGAWCGVSSGSIIQPLMELYRIRPKAEYLELVRETVAAFESGVGGREGAILKDAFRGDKIVDWHKTPCQWAKAYEIMSCLEGILDYYRFTGEKRILDAVLAYYAHLEREELNPMGSAGYFDHFVNAANRVNGMSELCDVVYWIRLNRSLLALTGEAKYADRIEEAFYNAFLSGVTRDGKWGAHIIRSHGSRHLYAPCQVAMKEHQCCPDNMMRTYFDIAGTIAAKGKDGALEVILYSDATAALEGAKVKILGGYPWAETPVVVNLDLASAGKVRFRVPAWSKEFYVNGKNAVATDGWYAAEAPVGKSAWEFKFDMSPRIDYWAARKENLPPAPVELNRDDVNSYSTYFMTWMAEEMRDAVHTTGGARVLRGPLVLAKGKLAGDTREETLFAESIRDFDAEKARLPGWSWKASLRPVSVSDQNAAVPAAWELTLTRGSEMKRVSVADFASLSNTFDPAGWFSVWF